MSASVVCASWLNGMAEEEANSVSGKQETSNDCVLCSTLPFSEDGTGALVPITCRRLLTMAAGILHSRIRNTSSFKENVQLRRRGEFQIIGGVWGSGREIKAPNNTSTFYSGGESAQMSPELIENFGKPILGSASGNSDLSHLPGNKYPFS